MKRFLKNLAKSFGIAAFAGFVTLTVCVAIVYLGGFEYGNKYAPDILRNVGILTLVMFWPLFLAQLITFKFDDINPEEDDTLDDEKELREAFPAEMSGLNSPDAWDADDPGHNKETLERLKMDEPVEKDVSGWEDDGYGGAIKK